MPPHLHPRSHPRTLADSSDPDALSGQPRRRRRKVPKDETCNDIMSEERRKIKEAEEWATPKRECPVPKPGGLIGQVLGLKKTEEEEEQPSITTQIQRARRKPRSMDEEGS
ncbi:hypothetical protein SLS60_010877 [Paraconiothyrium brasiliense]|uniref:Uncharacterized protein n=1 Tax=Paraconiothyrium brasiliense TaxID=300254 RepID=A0ABR3QM93_9PLEO